MITRSVLGFIGLAICSNFAFAGLAQKLGYDDSAKLLIIHADDVGMCHSVNSATHAALKIGIVSSSAIMVPCPWFPEIAAIARENPELDLGLHLTLTSEWKHYRWRPVSDPSKVPGLIDDEGFMWRSVAEVVENATPEEIETEIRAQIDRAIEFGIDPTHVDSHMGTLFAIPEFLTIYLKVAIDYGIPPMMPDPNSEETKKIIAERGIDFPTELISSLFATRIPLLDHLNLGEEGKTYEDRKMAYHNALRDLRSGVNQIIIHLSMNDDEIQNITNSWRNRYNEFRIFTDPETQKLIDELGIKLIGWREIKETMPKR